MDAAESPPRGRSSTGVWLVLAVIAAALLLVMWRGRGRGDAVDHPAVGKRLAVVDLPPLTGDAATIEVEQLQGKVTLINFWGPWCHFCLLELPHLVEMRAKLADERDAQFLFVSCSPEWQPDTSPAAAWSENLPLLQTRTAELLAERGFDIPTHSDPRGRTRQSFAAIAGWSGYPTTVLLDRDGVIRFVSIGYMAGDEHELEKQMRKLLAAQPSAERL